MKILHTSDWHLGRALYGRTRYDEFAAFLDWMVETIAEHAVDVLLIAGDVFDTSTPSNRAQELYYNFLQRVARSTCRHVVIIAGNHDSPSFLDAPGLLLRALDVHVVGRPADAPEDEVVVLKDAQGQTELIVCAVPYLRDRDIRKVEAGETTDDKERKLLLGIREHYASVVAHAQSLRAQHDRYVPVIGMGHLFTAGGQTIEGDGVRELYVGSLAHVSPAIFPDCLDYVALGHLHVAQTVGGKETIRYCGSPLPMGFGEARQQKIACLVIFDTDGQARTPTNDLTETADSSSMTRCAIDIACLPIPVFQPLLRLQGDWSAIESGLQTAKQTHPTAWVEINYDAAEIIGDLRERVEAVVAGSEIEVLRIRNARKMEAVMQQAAIAETLDDLDPHQVFQRCLDAYEVPTEQHKDLLDCYRSVLVDVLESDERAE